jgi:hypothetical protein
MHIDGQQKQTITMIDLGFLSKNVIPSGSYKIAKKEI